MIPKLTVTADANPRYSISPGNDTQDQVFLLSITEAYQYLSDRLCYPTNYADALYHTEYFALWLRTPGVDLNHIAFVFMKALLAVMALAALALWDKVLV